MLVALREVFFTVIPPLAIDDASNRFKRPRLALGLSIMSDIRFANRYSLTGPRTANLVRYCITFGLDFEGCGFLLKLTQKASDADDRAVRIK